MSPASKSSRTATAPQGDNPGTTESPKPCLVVGIGAASGGLAALEQVITALPTDCGVCYLVAVHLVPEDPCDLAAMLSRYTALPVAPAAEGMPLAPDRILVLPAGRELRLESGAIRLHPTELIPTRVPHPIDLMLGSLAAEVGEGAIGVILAGAGSDGATGARAAREAGGTVLVQDPTSCDTPGMPLAAIAAGAASWVLPVEEIAPRIAELARSHCALASSACHTSEVEQDLAAVLALVRARTGHDFSSYKPSTVLRRIERRMMLSDAAGIGRYLEVLKLSDQEAQALCNDILIGVTSFFRDPEPFEYLRRTILPRLFAGRAPDEPVRIWHACCATGEEAYSMAMLVREYLEEEGQNARVQIFASDLDDVAIAQARAGLYDQAAVASLGEARLRRFFTPCEGRWQVNKSLREMVIFAHHSLIKDPPFSRLDLLVCRNFLIYIIPEMQRRLISLFHQALKPGGFLFLGLAESVAGTGDLFATVHKSWKIYERREGGARIAHFPRMAPLMAPGGSPNLAAAQAEEASPVQLAQKALLDLYTPPGVVVNERYEVVHVFPRTGPFLEIREGELSRDLLRLAREELRPSLRAAIYKACAEQQEVVFKGIKAGGDPDAAINLRVRPVEGGSAAAQLVLVLFEPAPPLVTSAAESVTEWDGDPGGNPLVRQLEEQLRVTHEQLQATSEQLQSSHEGFLATSEELMSINEEYQSANEELQSTNEELETSKEELQALNEELATLNAELQVKVEELNQANTDMANLLASSGVATIFLDPSLVLKGFTPAAAQLFNLIPADIGRPFRHFAGRIDWPTLAQDAGRVLAGEPFAEREVATLDSGRTFLKRLFPYLTPQGEVDGVVVALIDITQRKQMECALREQEEKLRLFIEHAPAALAMFDNEMRYLSASRRWLSDYGLEERGLAGRSHYEVIPEIPEAWREAHRRGLAGEVLSSEGDPFLRADGSTQWIRWEIRPWYDARGSIGGIVIFAEDISNQMRVQRECEESEARYRKVVESVQVAIFINRKGSIEYANPAAVALFGAASADQVLGRSPLEFVHPDGHPVMQERIERLLREGSIEPNENRIRRLSGEERQVEVAAVRIEDHGEPAILVMMHDITERKNGEAALKQSEEQFRTLAGAIPQLCWMANGDGWIFWYNKRWYEYTGTTPEQMEGWGWQSVHDPQALPEVMERWRESIATGEPFDMVFPLRGADGVFRPFLTRVIPVRDSEGRVTRWFGSNTDITEQREREELLREAKLAAEGATRAKSRFLANMSHELRTPMTGVLGMLDLVLLGELEEEQREHLAMAQGSARSLLHILNDILDLTKIESGKLSIDRKPFSVRSCLEHTHHLLMPVARGKGLELRLEIAGEPPETVLGDQVRLGQVLTNLAGNALKFTEKGSVVLGVRCGARLDDGRREILFSVTDTGIGIPEDKRDLLFIEFSQLDDSHARRYGGTGLGLAISKEIVTRMGGTIGCESRPGEGSTFFFSIPFAVAAAAPAPRARAEEPVPAGLPRDDKAAQARLLVVEDDPVICAMLQKLLRMSGYQSELAGNGRQALDLWRQGGFDLVLMDVQMPGVDGFEATAAIRREEAERGGHVPIIAMTAHTLKEDERRCLEAGMDSYLSKPIDFNRCRGLIAELLAERKG
ncbi:hypothetical protein GMST_34880 [Geomonas silvestris]|uniref:Sensory/regulatory protein RpfC n=1 Tax=Geomonas silvestris TaxID=2740184 RepID=A0A6V8MN72_9BACT|nr:PAS domain S-box protein [Geomonas silvestris]GFO61163.1 hypothetical protein GMST_34880 [Geomonas silvestris]